MNEQIKNVASVIEAWFINFDLEFNFLPCSSQFDPFVKQPSIIKFTKKARLGDGVGRVPLKLN